MVGLLYGLRERGLDLSRPNQIIGTSGGSVVGTHLAAGITLDTMLAAQSASDDLTSPPTPIPDPKVRPKYEELIAVHPSPRSRRVRMELCQLALTARTITEGERLVATRARLPVSEWPVLPLTVISVRARDGQVMAWTRDSGVPLIQAIAASCALPGVYPPTTIDGERYVDGGVWSPVSAGLAIGHAVVVVIAPTGDRPTFADSLSIEVAPLEARGARIGSIVPDATAMKILGPNRMDPSRRQASVLEGRRQARELSLQSITP
jgi:NTE family protein